ncbi:hypothetical protein [Paenibacillus whitsoniae]|uniref:Uncharacterized protein n=1 Tax=Paenibacillus whitsoniae TaxID=2496558 RepID=A0A3S0AFC1_9BACL|nr:hypothetical protein [Paenibacillus whitsoniae]RTE11593.1 hypothetical protein EJQ19_01290 [Paenibacillus whitsoniae]
MKAKGTKQVFITFGFLSAITVIVLWATGLFGLWSCGMSFIANNTKDFTDKNGHFVEGKYSLKVNLSDLENNIGEEIYNDGDHRIFVSWFQRTHENGYEIEFRSSGKYSLAAASLISGVRHETNSDNSFTMITTAKMTVDYEGKTYIANATGQCGLNYKDGDCFSFIFFLDDEQHENNPIEHAGIVELIIADLYKNIWRKK